MIIETDDDGTVNTHAPDRHHPAMPVIARLTGRCANGAERDGGRRSHVVLTPRRQPQWETALCGATPGRLSNGWVEVDGAEQPTCPRCRTKADRLQRPA
jgi:hypothetical protein